jgi:hypothetical protein
MKTLSDRRHFANEPHTEKFKTAGKMTVPPAIRSPVLHGELRGNFGGALL